MKIKFFVIGLLILVLYSANTILSLKIDKGVQAGFHSKAELDYFRGNQTHEPIQPGEYFLLSRHCKACHGFDTLGVGNITPDGQDVNLYDDWRGTMMALSAVDPLWRAKVSHEILVNPAHSTELQTKCTSCHAPMGHYTAMFHGQTTYTIQDLENDSLGLDGVSCVGCHTIGTQGLGASFSGNIPFDTTHKEFGPFQNPVIGPMQLYIGLIPTYSPHVSQGKFCSPCHTLVTNSVDLSGNFTGTKYIEQATYHEWVNSGYSADNVVCQSCHMPQTKDSIVIANGLLNLAPRFPFNKHKFGGGNAFMTKLMKANKAALGIHVPDKSFDSALAATMNLLQHQTASVKVFVDSLTADTAYIKVRIINKAGHKFPSGYPARRAVLRMLVTNSNQDTIFKSGFFDSNYEVTGIDATYEPHYQVIRNQNQAQIYEMVMGDVNGNRTTVLERAYVTLKDNRLVPEGFHANSSVYDTVKIVGVGNDPDFNLWADQTDGSGRDFVYYHVPVAGLNGSLNINAALFYQSVPPRWVEEMFALNSVPINSFKAMYNAADRLPVLISSDQISLDGLSIEAIAESTAVTIYPNPTVDGIVNISSGNGLQIRSLKILDSTGKEIYSALKINDKISVELPQTKGVYIAVIETENVRVVRKMLRL
jgi:hypothetical protein